MPKPSITDRIIEAHAKAERLFGGGVTGELIQGRYDTQAVHAWFQKRHRVLGRRIVDPDHKCRISDERGDHEWTVPLGVRYALRQPLLWSQVATRYPWYVTWVSPRTGDRLKKKFESLASAIHFVTTRAQYVDPDAAIISRTGYDVPPPLRGKLPHPKLGYWCPCCLTARKFYAVRPEQTFYALKKDRTQGNRIKYSERKLRVLRCKVCGITNRDAKFRRSNQPWTKTRVPQGRHRIKRRRR